MSPDLSFALILVIKMAVTAAFVLAATITAERAGPLVGGLVATLPIAAGPAYVFLALDHDAHFISQSAVASLAVNAVNTGFAVSYTLLAQKRSLVVSLGLTYVGWIVLALSANSLHWAVGPAVLVNAMVIAVGLWLVRQRPSDYAALAHLDLSMLFTTFVLAVCATLLAGLLPAWRACQIAPALQLKSN